MTQSRKVATVLIAPELRIRPRLSSNRTLPPTFPRFGYSVSCAETGSRATSPSVSCPRAVTDSEGFFLLVFEISSRMTLYSFCPCMTAWGGDRIRTHHPVFYRVKTASDLFWRGTRRQLLQILVPLDEAGRAARSTTKHSTSDTSVLSPILQHNVALAVAVPY